MLMTADCASEQELLTDFHSSTGARSNLMMRMPNQTGGIQDFACSVAAGLSADPRRLDCRFLYDAEGSRLYEDICRQPEYYPTRTEAAILERCADDICTATGPVTMFELGSGCSVKTDHLLAAYSRIFPSLRYVPIDVSESALRQAGGDIVCRYPSVRFTGINGTYEDAFTVFQSASPALVLFLGSTIGNLNEEEAAAFWQAVSGNMAAGDFFLLGIDLVKDEDILNAAYNDAAGVTAAFTCNIFARMNRELDAGLDLEYIEPSARYNPGNQRIETHACFRKSQNLHIAPLGQGFTISEGEKILVEISRKFHMTRVAEELAEYGFVVRKRYTDDNLWFGVLLFQKK